MNRKAELVSMVKLSGRRTGAHTLHNRLGFMKDMAKYDKKQQANSLTPEEAKTA